MNNKKLISITKKYRYNKTVQGVANESRIRENKEKIWRKVCTFV